jgi:hypothetical protein
VFQVLVLVAGLENVIEQLDQGTRKEVQVSRCSKKHAWGKIIIEVHRTLAFLFICTEHRNKCLENENSYFQAEFENFKNSESGKTGKNQMRNLILCDLKKNGPNSSSKRKLRLF